MIFVYNLQKLRETVNEAVKETVVVGLGLFKPCILFNVRYMSVCGYLLCSSGLSQKYLHDHKVHKGQSEQRVN